MICVSSIAVPPFCLCPYRREICAFRRVETKILRGIFPGEYGIRFSYRHQPFSGLPCSDEVRESVPSDGGRTPAPTNAQQRLKRSAGDRRPEAEGHPRQFPACTDRETRHHTGDDAGLGGLFLIQRCKCRQSRRRRVKAPREHQDAVSVFDVQGDHQRSQG